MHAIQQPELDTFFRAATWLGSISVLFPAALALAWWFQRRGQPAAAVLLPLAVGGAWLLAHVGKLLIVRPRPELYPALIEMPADLSSRARTPCRSPPSPHLRARSRHSTRLGGLGGRHAARLARGAFAALLAGPLSWRRL